MPSLLYLFGPNKKKKRTGRCQPFEAQTVPESLGKKQSSASHLLLTTFTIQDVVENDVCLLLLE
jgi:hypothetical protein